MARLLTYIVLVLFVSLASYIWFIKWTTQRVTDREYNHDNRLQGHIIQPTRALVTTKYVNVSSTIPMTTSDKLGQQRGQQVLPPLSIPERAKEKVIAYCRKYVFENKSRAKGRAYNKPTFIITESAEDYQCDMLSLCQKEDALIEDVNTDNTSMRICPCFPPALRN